MILDPAVYAHVRRTFSKHDQDWEDRVHDAVVKFLTMDEPAEPIADARAYLATMARFRQRDTHRARVRHPHARIDAKGPDGQPSIAERLAAQSDREHRDNMRAIFHALKPGERRMVRLMLDGYTQAEIAKKLTIPHSTLKTRVRAIRLRTMATE